MFGLLLEWTTLLNFHLQKSKIRVIYIARHGKREEVERKNESGLRREKRETIGTEN